MTAKLMQEYRNNVWQLRPPKFFKKPAILIMDAHRAHLVSTVKSAFKQYNSTDVCIIPGGLTSILQMLDVYINRSFKCKLRIKYRNWLSEGLDRFTKSGKRAKAGYDEVAKWVSSSWQEIDQELIKKSFIGCGIALTRDESCLHSKLKNLMAGIPSEYEEEHSGITDDEDEIEIEDNEEIDID